jgi:hypothetical protein
MKPGDRISFLAPWTNTRVIGRILAEDSTYPRTAWRVEWLAADNPHYVDPRPNYGPPQVYGWETVLHKDSAQLVQVEAAFGQ